MYVTGISTGGHRVPARVAADPGALRGGPADLRVGPPADDRPTARDRDVRSTALRTTSLPGERAREIVPAAGEARNEAVECSSERAQAFQRAKSDGYEPVAFVSFVVKGRSLAPPSRGGSCLLRALWTAQHVVPHEKNPPSLRGADGKPACRCRPSTSSPASSPTTAGGRPRREIRRIFRDSPRRRCCARPQGRRSTAGESWGADVAGRSAPRRSATRRPR
jgi:hypothetical protein